MPHPTTALSSHVTPLLLPPPPLTADPFSVVSVACLIGGHGWPVLMQGASGQAVQNFNVMFGFPETTGLTMPPVFP